MVAEVKTIMQCRIRNPLRKAVARIAGVLAAGAALEACPSVEQDAFVYEGGTSPDPSAIVEGTVLYLGPRPMCQFGADHRPVRVIGNVLLTLFEYTNPPPPEGTATTSVNLRVVSGERLFQTSDCLPEGAPPNEADRVTRSVPFQWSRLVLERTQSKDYQVRGFYDYDEDMIPFFSVTRLPTAGDVAGAALNDIQNAAAGFLRITLPSMEAAPEGAIVPGVTVVLGNVVRTERPAFRTDQNRKLAANAPLEPEIDFTTTPPSANGPGSLRKFRALTCAAGGTDGVACGLTLLGFSAEDAAVAARSRVALDIANPTSYAVYSGEIDFRTVRVDEVDVAGADGEPDPHPFLGNGFGLRWFNPAIILQRQQSALELQTGIPRALNVGTVLIDLIDGKGVPTKSSYGPGADQGVPVAIPPVVALELIAGRNDCRVPYFAPGTSDVVAGNRLAHCGELPTGYYGINVFAGLAGGRLQEPADPTRSDSPSAFAGAGTSGQSWSVPNELGDPNQVQQANVLTHQSLEGGAFIIHDPTPMPGAQAACLATNLKGICARELQISEDTRGEGIDSNACLPDECCRAVAHLCGVRRCDMVQTPEGDYISLSPTAVTGTAVWLDDANQPHEVSVPDCVPFDMPSACCPQ